ncbi:aromatic amino acid DMT transporter YddG [Pseudoalteromonas luteoviolacea]|uniref:aromatic amino acid DMT transporter YddG n=1 Tax=Pseudoalteromonas luteoviolacea TaxID=43657 RepID=UPI0011512B86|nr:aromatic amino acid DMT transporter YddG [Pseudoalteromonas luteoviolacea]TQF70757.1 drug/metabolite DMT transporter permease [Pseudoalteromonas luteoviolacea]
MPSQYRCTIYGIVAVLIWSAVLHLVRIVSEDFGAIGGAALVYTYSAIFLVSFLGIPTINKLPKKYILIGGALFVSYELCLSLSLGFSNSREQSTQVLIVNYLWPTFTVLGAIISKQNKANLMLLVPGCLLAFIGICFVVSDNITTLFNGVVANVSSNPIAFVLAFFGAIIWAVYCNVTKSLSGGQNAVTLFFIFTALTLWSKWYLLNAGFTYNFSFKSVFILLLAGGGMALGYGLWNKAIISGNMIILAAISYFTPVFSGIFAAVILNVELTSGFWIGVTSVTFGSLLCWQSTRLYNHSNTQVQTVLDNTE